MMKNIVKIIFCHLLGDYVLLSDKIENSMDTSWYHLFVHSMLYILPFYITFGFDYKLIIIFISHFVINALRYRYNLICYSVEQFTCFILLLIYLDNFL